LRIPPSAGSASGVLPNPLGYNRVYVHLDGPFSYDAWWQGLRAGRCFVTNGPLLRVRANGALPGHVFAASAGQALDIDLAVKLDGNDPVPALEIIKDGEIDRVVPAAEARASGRLGRVRFERSGWFLVRAVAEAPGTFRCAATGPFYVEIGEEKRRTSARSARFFVDWVEERSKQLRLDDPAKRAEVLRYHEAAKRFWRERLERATAP
jgi:hypothetical protein